MERELYQPEHEAFRASVRTWIDREVAPRRAEWEAAGVVPRSLFTEAGRLGFLAFEVDGAHGGGGVDDFRFNAVFGEELQLAGLAGIGLGLTLHNDICLPYFLRCGDEDQHARWLPGIASGHLVTAIAMTEPGAGSDLASITTRAVRHGDHYIVNGSKTFITNGHNADLVVTAVKTDPDERHRGISLLVIERGMPGFDRGPTLEKIGQHAQDTAELFFTGVEVPVTNRLGPEGEGFFQLVANLPRERLSMAVAGVAAARAALNWTLDYVTERRAFGQTVGSFQNTRFELAEVATELAVAESFVDRCVTACNAGRLAPEEAAMAKWWCTELQKRTVDRCLQLFGGYGYLTEYPIARAYLDARVTTIYGGTTEIMKEIIGRSLGL